MRIHALLGLFTIVGVGLLAAEAPSSPVPSLRAAIEHYGTGEGRWAYRQVLTDYDRKGRIKRTEVSRVDPSLPWEDREVLLATESGPATAREQQRFQRERRKERRKQERGDEQRFRLRDRMDFAAGRVVAETTEHVKLQIPILPDPARDQGFPVEQIELTVDLNQSTGELAAIAARLREPVRHRTVAKIRDLALAIRFEAVSEAGRPPALVKLAGTAAASVLFFPVGGEIQITRTEHRWVTPYDERFNVEIGTATAIDF